MMRYLIRGAFAVLVLLLLTVIAWRTQRSRTFQLMGTFVPRVETADSVVALTFDDGPTPGYAETIVAMLAAKRVRATFFVVGSEVERFPDQARRLVEAGHELGNHSYTHRRLVLKRLSTIRDEVERTDRLIREAGHEGPIHFRAPYGKRLLVLPYYLSKTERTHVMWDVEPESYGEVAGDLARIVEHVVERVRPGSIVLLHTFYPDREASRRAVPGIIDALKARGYRFVTVSELLGRAG